MATNAEAEYVRPRGPNDGGAEFADTHGLDSLLLPFAYRETDPIYVGRKLSAAIADLRQTAATFRPYEPFEDDEVRPDVAIVRHHVHLRGSWQIDSYRRKHVNPNYVHVESFDHNVVTDTDERLRILDQMAATGIPTLFDLAPRFGLSPGELHAFCEAHDVGWQAKRREGRRRLARTARVAVEWGYSLEAVADALPLTTAALGQWIAEYGEMEYVPDDPSIGISGGE